MRAREPRRPLDALVGRVGLGERDVGGDGVVEEERVLEHDADGTAQRVQGNVAHVDAVEDDASAVDVVEPRDQAGDGRLAAAGRADQRHRLARLHSKVEASSTGRSGPAG